MTNDLDQVVRRALGRTYTRRDLLRQTLAIGAGTLALSIAGGSVLTQEVAACAMPLAPTNLTKGRSGGCPYLLWEMSGTGGSGSRVERSTDGANFAPYHNWPYPSDPTPYSVYIDHTGEPYGYTGFARNLA